MALGAIVGVIGTGIRCQSVCRVLQRTTTTIATAATTPTRATTSRSTTGPAANSLFAAKPTAYPEPATKQR